MGDPVQQLRRRCANPLCSVGLQLDPRLYAERPDLSPEEEFFAFLDRYPDMARHLRGGKAVRPWTCTGRIQYSSARVVGDRYCLLGHAAGFVDPLFSKGLYATLSATFLCAHLLLQAQNDGDYSAARFAPLETLTLNYLDSADACSWLARMTPSPTTSYGPSCPCSGCWARTRNTSSCSVRAP